jgi:transposase
VDETTLGLHPVLRACWMKKGTQKHIDTPGQQQWHHLFGAYNFLTDEVITMPSPRKNSDAFVAFLDTLVQQTPDERPLVLVLDNASYHHSEVATAGLAALENRLVPFFLPPYCSNLNPIERFWGHLKGLACANTLFPTMFALIVSVVINLAHQNDPTNPERFSICKDL